MDTQITNLEEDFTTNARYLAVKLLNRFDRSDSYTDKLLSNTFSKREMTSQEKALITELVNGVIRWRLKLDYILIGFYHGDYQKCLNLIKNALRVALYQILYLDKVPDYASINESVEIVKHIQGERTANLVNAVLRNILRSLENIRYPNPADDFHYYLGIIHSHPKWMSKRFCTIMGDDEATKFMEYNNKRPYTPIRINLAKTNMEEVKAEFDKLEIAYEQPKFLDNCLKLTTPRMDISQTEIFLSGKITIQDPAATIAVRLATPQPGNAIADVCAAPGGKTVYMAELMNNEGNITAYDLHPFKLRLITESAQRLGWSNIQTSAEDSSEIVTDKQFDIVFADLPCTGFGTIRKKPDIKWKREFVDIKKLADAQLEIVENVCKMVKIGGRLIYSTCTIDPDENELNVEEFLKRHPEFEIDPAENYLPAEFCHEGMMRIYPQKFDIDGAFAARLKRIY